MDPQGSSVEQDEDVRMRLLRRSQQRLEESSLRVRGSMQVSLKGAARKVPMDALAKEWLHCSNAGLETRRYLAENLLPSLVLSLEKLLMEVGSRELEGVEESRPEFNPINYLAQQLMRNNPRYSHLNTSSHYSQSMREVVTQLQQMASHGEEEIERMRQELRRRKEQREREAALQLAEEKRRVGVVQEVVDHWCELKAGDVQVLQVSRCSQHLFQPDFTSCSNSYSRQSLHGWKKSRSTLNLVFLQVHTAVPPHMAMSPLLLCLLECLAALVFPEVDHKEMWTAEKSCEVGHIMSSI